MYYYSNIIINSQKVETTQMSIYDKQMNCGIVIQWDTT